MKSFPLGGMPATQFVHDYWHKRPLLVRRAWPEFEPPIDGDDLAGLACDALAEARLVTGNQAAGYSVRYGPFAEADFHDLPPADWTLLVQDVEKHYPPLAELLDAFSFIPVWRLDDIMVSFAAPGGGVGPHVDQYDVFLFQASGRRRWQIAEHFDPALVPDSELKVLQHFTACTEWTLEAGDLLYLPPGVAHHGVAVNAGLTYSIGLRAPSVADILAALADEAAQDEAQWGRYRDSELEPNFRQGEIDCHTAIRFQALLADSPAGAAGTNRDWLAKFLSEYRLAQRPAAPECPVTLNELQAHLQTNGRVQRNPWTRLAWCEVGSECRLYAAGQRYRANAELAERLCSRRRLSAADLTDSDLPVTLELANDGHLFLTE